MKYITISIIVIALGIGGVMVFSGSPKELPAPVSIPSTPIQTPEVIPVEPLRSSGPFYLSTLGENPGAELTALVGPANVATVLALNRLDEKHMSKGMTVVVPASFDDTEAFESFPLVITELKEVPKIMLVSQNIQAFALYEYGERLRSGPVSTGKKSTPSPSNLYFTNWKGKLVTSSIDDEWIMPWYFNLDNKEGISLHQYDLPGYPASHACVRMYEWDAKFIYDWADQWKISDDGETVLANGTPVLMFGEYAYGTTAPWKNLPENKDAIKITDDELTKVLAPILPTIVTTRAEN